MNPPPSSLARCHKTVTIWQELIDMVCAGAIEGSGDLETAAGMAEGG
jgi:hypothetical protein